MWNAFFLLYRVGGPRRRLHVRFSFDKHETPPPFFKFSSPPWPRSCLSLVDRLILSSYTTCEYEFPPPNMCSGMLHALKYSCRAGRRGTTPMLLQGPDLNSTEARTLTALRFATTIELGVNLIACPLSTFPLARRSTMPYSSSYSTLPRDRKAMRRSYGLMDASFSSYARRGGGGKRHRNASLSTYRRPCM